MRLIDSQIASLCRGEVPSEIRAFYSQIGVTLPATIAPMIEPFDVALINPASLDIRIGTSIKVMKHGWFLAPEFLGVDLSEYAEGLPYWIYPGDRLLAASLETFKLPPFLTGTFKLKSSRGREFWQHIMAGFADPGWNDSKLTMELINLSHSPLPIYPGLKIGQMVFDLTFGLPVADYSVTGRYNGDVVAAESKG
jgi:dCTP deaminase